MTGSYALGVDSSTGATKIEIVDIATGELCGFEALMRWQRDGHMVPPGDFITIAEETGVECEPVRLLSVIDGQRMGFSRFGMYMLLFHCRATGGELEAHPLETSDVGWFGPAPALPVRSRLWGVILVGQSLRG